MIKATITYDNIHIPEKAECPRYCEILIKGHATDIGVSTRESVNGHLASRICSAVTSQLACLKNVLELYDGIEVVLSSGYFRYTNNCIINDNPKKYSTNFEPSLEYRVDTIVWLLAYLNENYPDYVSITYKEKEN